MSLFDQMKKKAGIKSPAKGTVKENASRAGIPLVTSTPLTMTPKPEKKTGILFQKMKEKAGVVTPAPVEKKATYEEIRSKGEVISQAPDKRGPLLKAFDKFAPDFVKDGVQVVKEGLFGREEIGAKGKTVSTGGALRIGDVGNGPLSLFSKRNELTKFNETNDALVAAGIDADRAGKIASEYSDYGNETELDIGKRMLRRLSRNDRLKALNLNDTEKKIVRTQKIMNAVDTVFASLDAVSFGTIKLPASTIQRIAQATDERVIQKLLKTELPNVSEEAIGEFSKVLKHVDNAGDVEKALNRIEYQTQVVKKGAEAPTEQGVRLFDQMVEKAKSARPEALQPVTDTARVAATTIPSDLNPLTEEARKYKSAEEFVSSQKPVYRGGDPVDLTKGSKMGISVSTDRSVAERFGKGKIVDELIISPQAKIFDAEKATPSLLKNAPSELAILEYARANGYDAIDFTKSLASMPGTGYLPENEIRILNPKVLQTKSQLTDFYNQATGGSKETPSVQKPEITDGVKYSIEETRVYGKPAFKVTLGDQTFIAESKSSVIRQVTEALEKMKKKDIVTPAQTQAPEIPVGPIKVDYVEANQALKERGRIDLRESKRNIDALRTRPLIEQVSELETMLQISREALEADPARELVKFVSKRGEFSGQLKEVTGKKGSIFGQKGDDIAKSLGFEDSETARNAYDNYVLKQRRVYDIATRLQEARKELAGARKEDKDAKSLDYLLTRKANNVDDKVAAQAKEKDRQERVKKATEEGAKKAEETAEKISSLGEKVRREKIRAVKEKNLTNVIKAALYPINSLDETTKKITEDWIKKLQVAKEKGQEAFKEANSKGFQDMRAVIDYQAGSQEKYIREAFDDLGTEFKRRGLDFEWMDENYIPQVWMSNSDFVGAAKKYLKEKGMTEEEILEYMAGEELPKEKAIRLRLRPNFVKERFWPDYKTGIAHGLKPKYKTPAQLIGYYREMGERSLANQEYIQELKSEAKLLPIEDAPDTWEPVSSLFSREGLYAHPSLARMINGRFRDEAKLGFYDSFVKRLGAVAKLWFDLKTMSGVPFTTVNSFAMGQAIKLGASVLGDLSALDLKEAVRDLKSMFAFIRANSNSASLKWYDENKKFIALAAHEGLDLFGRRGTFENFHTKLKDYLPSGSDEYGSIRKGLNKTGHILKWSGITFKNALTKPTTDMLAQISLQTFKNVYTGAVEKGLSEEAARKVAASTTRNFLGIVGDVGRGINTTDTLNSVFTAPYFREGVINTLWNAAKGWSSSFKNPLFYKSRRLLLGMIVMYGIYNALNKAINGEFMWDNPPGREWQLRIPLENGDVLYIDYLPSFFAIARNLTSGAINFVRGDFDTAKQKFGSVLSTPFQIITELWANKDYFGREIWKDLDSGKEKMKKAAAYVGLSASHPYSLEVSKIVTGEQPLYQGLVRMAEFPVKFGNLTKEQTSEYYKMLDENKKKRAFAKNGVRPKYDEIHGLLADGKKKEAMEVYKTLTKSERELYKQIKSDIKRSATNKRKPAIQAIYDTNQALIENGRIDEAKEIFKNLSKEDREIYSSIKEASEKAAGYKE